MLYGHSPKYLQKATLGAVSCDCQQTIAQLLWYNEDTASAFGHVLVEREAVCLCESAPLPSFFLEPFIERVNAFSQNS